MRTTILSAFLVTALAASAQAQSYPISGKWGESTSSEKGAIDCTNSTRVMEFSGNQRTDSNGAVPAYRNKSVVSEGPSSYRVVDEFSNAQVSAGQSAYTLRKLDADRIEINEGGSALTLRRCK